MMSVAIPSCGQPPWIIRAPSGSPREILSKYTPVKMTRNPARSEIVLTASDVLKPPYRMNEATNVAVVKVT